MTADSTPSASKLDVKVRARDVDVFYAEKQALNSVSLDVEANRVTALIGPSGCGKSTFIRCLNRMNDTIDICRVSGSILLDGNDIYGEDMDVVQLRARVGMVFQNPIRFRNRFTTTWPMDLVSTAWPPTRTNSITS